MSIGCGCSRPSPLPLGEGETRKIALGWSDLGIAPGDVVAIAGETGRWRVTGWSWESMVLTLDLVRLASATLPASASSGRVLATPDLTIGTTIVHAFEAPPLDDSVLTAPRLLIAAAGTGPGWRRAALLLSLDDGASWTNVGATAAPAVIGTIATIPGAASAALADRRDSFEVDLARGDMTLASADVAALDGGANLALVGDELLQFGTAEPLGGTRWRLSTLWRGRRGTEAAIGGHKAGDRFVLIAADNVAVAQVPLSAMGATARVLASGVGDIDGPSEADAAVTGASVLPPSPVHVSAVPQPNGDVALTWVRRSRAGWRWIDGADAPLVEERELYRVTIAPAAGPARTVETSVPSAIVTAADRAAGAVTVSVRQAGSCGESPAAAITIAAGEG